MKQLKELHSEFDKLQNEYGDSNLNSIYGAGETSNPEVMFIFMNPTGRNISSTKDWKGLRAPWIGTKQVWDIFKSLELIDNGIFQSIKSLKPQEWDEKFASDVYSEIQNHSVYITNLAKCTQVDARPLSNTIFKDYLNLMYKEIEVINPDKIITFGNQVSSILLKNPISVSNYMDDNFEVLELGKKYKVFPTYYPVGQGRRNMPKAIQRIKVVLGKS